ncbi:MAG: DUF3570 domain-containing protein [Methylococcaceae bacterium]|nr:DUF3570 domain-containing protein [Methylococcaceae bacterium]
MAAALALPGLAAADEGDTVDFQYGHYEEGHRQIYGIAEDYKLKALPYHNPITVDSLRGAARVSLTDRLRFGFNYQQDTWGGATPISTAPAAFGQNNAREHTASGASPHINSIGAQGAPMLFDRTLRPLLTSLLPTASKYRYTPEPALTHVLATASPETRKQGDFRLGYRWDMAELSAGGGLSVENDYDSRFVNLGGRFDFNRKLTTLDLGLSYTSSDTHAIIDPNANAYLLSYNYPKQVDEVWVPAVSTNYKKLENIQDILTGSRRDWGATLGLTQVLTKSALVQAGLGYTRSSGYLANPYKVVETYWVDPDQAPNPERPGTLATSAGAARAFLERRPEQRHQWTGDLRYVQHLAPLDAALHLNYRLFHDDWGIDSHTFEADWVQPLGGGWTLTPRARYYSQSAADFYHPYLVVPHAYDTVDDIKRPARTAKAHAKNLSRLPSAYSSDHRLSAYGAFSWGVTLAKRFSRGVSLEAGFEHYTHGGGLRLGGGGEADFADFDYWVANAALRVDLPAPGRPGDEDRPHAHHHGTGAPAGVMFAHMLDEPGALMAGYRYMYGRQAGALLHRGEPAASAEAIRGGCPPLRRGCVLGPQSMDMHMHMVELMYAPTSWLNLMLMPQFVDMEMQLGNQLRDLITTDDAAQYGRPPERFESGTVSGNTDSAIGMHKFFTHATGGIGDTGLYAMARLWEGAGQRVHLTAGVTAPTGAINRRMRLMHQENTQIVRPNGKIKIVQLPERLYDYGMQLGSGTWDFKPSLTYAGLAGSFSWGAQAAATVRLEDQNELGYALGDGFQATAWAGYSPLPWMTLTARGLYTTQGAIRGGFQKIHEEGVPTDYPDNYGGRYWDAGFGLNLLVPTGAFAGNRLAVEWLQPLYDDPNGYQLKRQGSLSATWSLVF